MLAQVINFRFASVGDIVSYEAVFVYLCLRQEPSAYTITVSNIQDRRTYGSGRGAAYDIDKKWKSRRSGDGN